LSKQVSKSHRKIAEKGKIDTQNTQTHDRSLSWLVYRHFNQKNDGVKLFLWAKISPLGEMKGLQNTRETHLSIGRKREKNALINTT
jgi:hypothetical protein